MPAHHHAEDTRTGRNARGRGALVAAVVAFALTATACASGGDNATDLAERSSTTTATAASLPAEVAALPGAEGITPNEDGVDPLPPLPDDVALPLVFVHGFAGSAQQYESQAMRFAANGYPPERIVAYDHDGSGTDIASYVEGLTGVVDTALADFGVHQIYLVGHSRGTTVSSAYLADPARAAKVAKYVAIDGALCPDAGAVPCLAPTQDDHPGQAHVEVATSPESFAMQYEFLVGEPPAVVDIVPQRQPVILSGRAVNFPLNTGRGGTTLDVWEVDPGTGARRGGTPHVSFAIGADGAFGPFVVRSGAHYEYVLSSESTPVRHHLYLQPYVRSSHLLRLLSSPPDGVTRANTNTGDGHSALIAIRMREWYANDHPDAVGGRRDVLLVGVRENGRETPAVDVLADFVGNRAIGIHLHDDATTPGETTLAALPYFSTQPFQSGVDVFLPASADATGTITVTNIPRGVVDRPQTLNVPNWPSSTHSVSVVFTDYPVD